MTKLIAETAWHHEGDFSFMYDLVSRVCNESVADIVKMHITLDLDEYMNSDHGSHDLLKSWMLSSEQWKELIEVVQGSGKEVMLLLNDTTAVEFASQSNPDYVEIHSVCLNVPALQAAIFNKIDKKVKVVIGVGGCSIQEIDAAIHMFEGREIILMFGFQNYPTKYKDVNLSKIRKVQLLYSNKYFGYADHTAWDDSNNELITLLVAANGMSYIEKHVTTVYGEERCDYSSAISIELFNQLSHKIKILDQVKGNGFIQLNSGERAYSKYGPMKMAAVMKYDVKQGEKLKMEDIRFCRTGQVTQISQIEVIELIGCSLRKDVAANQVINREYFEE